MDEEHTARAQQLTVALITLNVISLAPIDQKRHPLRTTITGKLDHFDRQVHILRTKKRATHMAKIASIQVLHLPYPPLVFSSSFAPFPQDTDSD